MGDNAQKRLLSLLVLATFITLQIPLKRLVKELVPGRRGPKEDVAEALVQGTARVAAVILASTIIRGLADDRDPSPASDTNTSAGEGAAEVAVEL
ncbi:hypothetical protein GBA65_09240 [Rubrobacter marinus]|uniref:Uncharacterized protein n=1 Tax=Rubrobacter marinus TaxID=2653852 RepID=A0A6G8PWU1_9ACTN|nr:hypothetical protein [Rubrobacter marinus]QIN78672.1 hypothetical protein GBA65_09240 [Rubrobacter marinus]